MINEIKLLFARRVATAVILSCIFIGLTIFLWRNPYGDETLIPNFEPFPDTFHYIVPAIELSQGRSPLIRREGYEFPASVPPLYSLFLTSGYLIHPDPHSYYFTNAILMFLTFGCLLALLKRITKSLVAAACISSFFLLNFYANWLPSLAMAENLLIPLFLAQLLVLYKPLTKKSSIIGGLLTLAPFVTKYAAAPLTVGFFLLFLLKMMREVRENESRVKKLPYFISLLLPFLYSVSICFGMYALYQITVGQPTIFDQVWYVLEEWFFAKTRVVTTSGESVTHIGFSLQYTRLHFMPYLLGVWGKSESFLWHKIPFWPLWLSAISCYGYLQTFYFLPRLRFFIAGILLYIVLQTVFISTFYVIDLRYVSVFLPLVPIGLALFYRSFPKKIIALGILIALFFIYGYSQRALIYRTLHLNFTAAAERPWYSIFIRETEDFLTREQGESSFFARRDQSVVLVSPFVPFLHDFAEGNEYELLPLSRKQDFFYPNNPALLWGIKQNVNTPEMVLERHEAGRKIYILFADIGVVSTYKSDFDALAEIYQLEEVYRSCEGECVLYEIVRTKEGTIQ